MKIWLPTLFLFLIQPAHARVFIRDPGCYFAYGKIAAAKRGAMNLRIDGGTRSEIELKIKLDHQKAPLPVGKFVTLKVLARESGRAEDLEFVGFESSIKETTKSQVTPPRALAWSGETKQGQCD